MAKKRNKTVAASKVEAAASKVEVVVKEKEKVVEGEIIRVRAVIRSMYAPFDGIMISDEGPGVLIKRGSWVDVQLERGLIKKC